MQIFCRSYIMKNPVAKPQDTTANMYNTCEGRRLQPKNWIPAFAEMTGRDCYKSPAEGG